MLIYVIILLLYVIICYVNILQKNHPTSRPKRQHEDSTITRNAEVPKNDVTVLWSDVSIAMKEVTAGVNINQHPGSAIWN